LKTPEFEWDEHNLRRIKRHNVEAEEAEQALANDPLELEPWYLESEELPAGRPNERRPLAYCRRAVQGTEGPSRYGVRCKQTVN